MPRKSKKLHSATDLLKHTKLTDIQWVLFIGVAYLVTVTVVIVVVY